MGNLNESEFENDLQLEVHDLNDRIWGAPELSEEENDVLRRTLIAEATGLMEKIEKYILEKQLVKGELLGIKNELSSTRLSLADKNPKNRRRFEFEKNSKEKGMGNSEDWGLIGRTIEDPEVSNRSNRDLVEEGRKLVSEKVMPELRKLLPSLHFIDTSWGGVGEGDDYAFFDKSASNPELSEAQVNHIKGYVNSYPSLSTGHTTLNGKAYWTFTKIIDKQDRGSDVVLVVDSAKNPQATAKQIAEMMFR